MGLDVYVKWDNMTDDEKKAQYSCGFHNSGAAGYLRKSWGSLEVWNNIFDAIFNKDWTSFLYPQWTGLNGEEFSVDKESRLKLENSLKKLTEYIDNPIPVPQSVCCFFDTENKQEIILNECREMANFIRLALSKPGATIIFG